MYPTVAAAEMSAPEMPDAKPSAPDVESLPAAQPESAPPKSCLRDGLAWNLLNGLQFAFPVYLFAALLNHTLDLGDVRSFLLIMLTTAVSMILSTTVWMLYSTFYCKVTDRGVFNLVFERISFTSATMYGFFNVLLFVVMSIPVLFGLVLMDDTTALTEVLRPLFLCFIVLSWMLSYASIGVTAFVLFVHDMKRIGRGGKLILCE